MAPKLIPRNHASSGGCRKIASFDVYWNGKALYSSRPGAAFASLSTMHYFALNRCQLLGKF